MSGQTFTDGIDPRDYIVVRGARQHNLKNLDLNLPKRRINVITGPSGSGKSSLAFNTIFAEGQRRYMECLSAYARQFLVRMDKPDVDFLAGLAPAIAIEQAKSSRNQRSTVATQTEVFDYLRLLFAQVGTTYSPISGEPVAQDAPRTVAYALEKDWADGTRFYLAFARPMGSTLASLQQCGYGRLLDLKARQVINMDTVDEESASKGLLVLQDRLVIRLGDEDNATRIASSVQQAYGEGNGYCVAVPAREDLKPRGFSEHFERDGMYFVEPTPQLFSFNSPVGACPTCQGLGRIEGPDRDLVIPDPQLSLVQGALAPLEHVQPQRRKYLLERWTIGRRIDLDRPFRSLPIEEQDHLWHGIRSLLDPRLLRGSGSTLLPKHFRYTAIVECTDCNGFRLRKEALYVKIGGLHVGEILELTTQEAHKFFEQLTLTPFQEEVAATLLKELRHRLRILVEVGLGYVALNRPSRTLSGGESQRISLAASLGSALVGSLYVLDEPTIGLHPRDTLRLISILQRLRDLGNTVLVVEHDGEVMKHADEIVDLGPGSGDRGGEVTFQGTYEAMVQSEASLTGRYCSQRSSIPVPKTRRTPDWSRAVTVKGARAHNLKRITTSFPLGLITVVTGVSGSGKSTLVHKTLYRGLRRQRGAHRGDGAVGTFDSIVGGEDIFRVELVDQSPIGRSSRSNPATYSKAFDGIRKLFAGTYEGRLRGYTAGHFSFNVEGGRCEACEGEGVERIQMQFLADLLLECEECGGTRFKEQILQIRYEGKNIHEVLDMTIDGAIDFFASTRSITSPLQKLSEVGLGYLRLGQPAPTLSGGEAQRVKLASHIASNSPEHVLYVFDEPTTGLHFDDIRKLLAAFTRLVELGHTIVIVEHNIDVIKAADWVIDLGPEGGFAGGKIVAEGPPEVVAQSTMSHTAPFLREVLREKNGLAAVTFA